MARTGRSSLKQDVKVCFVKAMQVKNAKAVGEAAHELDMAVVVGAPEGEGLYIFLNADDRHTLEKAEHVVMRCAVNSQL
jgi:hypothetical protein